MQHPNQSRDEMEALQNIYDKIKNEKHAAAIFTGDYHCRSSLFWENDIENWIGRIFSNFLLSNNLVKLINEPTHIRDDGTQLSVNRLFTFTTFPMLSSSEIFKFLQPLLVMHHAFVLFHSYSRINIFHLLVGFVSISIIANITYSMFFN